MQMHNHNLIDSLQDVKEQTDSFDMRVESMPQKLKRRIEEQKKDQSSRILGDIMQWQKKVFVIR